LDLEERREASRTFHGLKLQALQERKLLVISLFSIVFVTKLANLRQLATLTVKTFLSGSVPRFQHSDSVP